MAGDHSEEHFTWLQSFRSKIKRVNLNFSFTEYIKLLKNFESLISEEVSKLKSKPKRSTKFYLILKSLLGTLKLIDHSKHCDTKTNDDLLALYGIILTHIINLVQFSSMKDKLEPKDIACAIYSFVKVILEMNSEYVLDTVLSSTLVEDITERNSIKYQVLKNILQEKDLYNHDCSTFFKYLTIFKFVKNVGDGNKKLSKALLETVYPLDFNEYLETKLKMKYTNSDDIDLAYISNKIKTFPVVKDSKARLSRIIDEIPQSKTNNDNVSVINDDQNLLMTDCDLFFLDTNPSEALIEFNNPESNLPNNVLNVSPKSRELQSASAAENETIAEDEEVDDVVDLQESENEVVDLVDYDMPDSDSPPENRDLDAEEELDNSEDANSSDGQGLEIDQVDLTVSVNEDEQDTSPESCISAVDDVQELDDQATTGQDHNLSEEIDLHKAATRADEIDNILQNEIIESANSTVEDNLEGVHASSSSSSSILLAEAEECEQDNDAESDHSGSTVQRETKAVNDIESDLDIDQIMDMDMDDGDLEFNGMEITSDEDGSVASNDTVLLNGNNVPEARSKRASDEKMNDAVEKTEDDSKKPDKSSEGETEEKRSYELRTRGKRSLPPLSKEETVVNGSAASSPKPLERKIPRKSATPELPEKKTTRSTRSSLGLGVQSRGRGRPSTRHFLGKIEENQSADADSSIKSSKTEVTVLPKIKPKATATMKEATRNVESPRTKTSSVTVHAKPDQAQTSESKIKDLPTEPNGERLRYNLRQRPKV